MQVLLWLVPPVLVTLLAMAWVSWLGREGRGLVDRDEAVARLGAALDAEPRRRRRRPGYVAPRPARERSSGVAVRGTRPVPPPPADRPVARPVARPSDGPSDGPGDRPVGSRAGTDPERFAS